MQIQSRPMRHRLPPPGHRKPFSTSDFFLLHNANRTLCPKEKSMRRIVNIIVFGKNQQKLLYAIRAISIRLPLRRIHSQLLRTIGREKLLCILIIQQHLQILFRRRLLSLLIRKHCLASGKRVPQPPSHFMFSSQRYLLRIFRHNQGDSLQLIENSKLSEHDYLSPLYCLRNSSI